MEEVGASLRSLKRLVDKVRDQRSSTIVIIGVMVQRVDIDPCPETQDLVRDPVDDLKRRQSAQDHVPLVRRCSAGLYCQRIREGEMEKDVT